MAKVYEFPKQTQLPQEVKDCLYEIADAYIKTLNYAFTILSGDDPTNAELQEIQGLVVQAYAEGLEKAVNNMEES